MPGCYYRRHCYSCYSNTYDLQLRQLLPLPRCPVLYCYGAYGCHCRYRRGCSQPCAGRYYNCCYPGYCVRDGCYCDGYCTNEKRERTKRERTKRTDGGCYDGAAGTCGSVFSLLARLSRVPANRSKLPRTPVKD